MTLSRTPRTPPRRENHWNPLERWLKLLVYPCRCRAANSRGSARPQADFLRFINERLAPKFQVIYATHSPFMIEPSHLGRVRILQDKGVDAGTVVSQDVTTVDSDSLLPLKAALGHDVRPEPNARPGQRAHRGCGRLRQIFRRCAITSSPLPGTGNGTLAQSRQHGDRWRLWDHDGCGVLGPRKGVGGRPVAGRDHPDGEQRQHDADGLPSGSPAP